MKPSSEYFHSGYSDYSFSTKHIKLFLFYVLLKCLLKKVFCEIVARPDLILFVNTIIFGSYSQSPHHSPTPHTQIFVTFCTFGFTCSNIHEFIIFYWQNG